jgi:hypothetical protein
MWMPAHHAEEDGMIPDQLKLQPGQEALTPEQEAEARRFADERIAAQLSTGPVEEQEAERLLRQAYAVARLSPPIRILWVDGPLQLAVAQAPQAASASECESVWKSRWHSVQESVWKSVRERVGASVWERVWESVRTRVEERVRENVWASVWDSMDERARPGLWRSVAASLKAYDHAPHLAFYRFFDAYLTPNTLHVLAHFNEQISGYWLGQEEAILVRRPCVLARDEEGRLHSTTAHCLEYGDGWGFYAWHGVRVPERFVLRPETLAREDFLNEPNVEVRRVLQERMGERFVAELGGVVLDTGPSGTLYEVVLPDDPERVARYVQVRDASTERWYFLRVPPTTQTAAEAVAWTFQIGVYDYRPAQET